MNINELKKLNKEEILNYWESLGFLQGLSDNDAKNISILFNDMAIYILENQSKYTNKEMEALVFPMIRRAYGENGLGDTYTPEKMCDVFEATFKPFTQYIKKHFDNIDPEVEYCSVFSQIFSKYKI